MEQGAPWLVVGLGNRGEEYTFSRHNLGFWTVDHLAVLLGAERWLRLSSMRFATAIIGNVQIFVLKPQDWMNNSGYAVGEAATKWGIPLTHTIVVCDDVALPDGKLRLRISGSSGGHRGLKSVIERLGSQDFPRLRIGVGSQRTTEQDLSEYVLEKLTVDQIEYYTTVCARGADALMMVLNEDFSSAMTYYNQPLRQSEATPAGDGSVSKDGGQE